MRVLLDTNILIHREAATVVRGDIGTLFQWLDRLHYEKCIHPVSVAEIGKHEDPRVRATFKAKLSSYHELKTVAPLATEVAAVGATDATENDRNDTLILNELYADRVDFLISEDRILARKAGQLGIGDRVFTIDGFLEKVAAENPNLVEYKVLAVQKRLFGEVPLEQRFFDSFRQQYDGFDRWFNRKSDETAYVCTEEDKIIAFLYLKVEGPGENYFDIEPAFAPKRRLKVGTLKVALNSYRLGERFFKILFDNAIRQRVDEVYVTAFPTTVDGLRLIRLFEDFGFVRHGTKHNYYGDEAVYVRDMTPRYDAAHPRLTFPYVSRLARSFIVPIYPDYHTSLLPDSILNTESPADFIEHEPHRNAISKVYVCRSMFRDLKVSDVIVFYRTAPHGQSGYYHGVVTTLGIVEDVHDNIKSEQRFISLCRGRSVFSDDELRGMWNWKPFNRPFITGFLYAYSFPKRPNRKALIEHGVIRDAASGPRGFELLSQEQLSAILTLSNSDARIVVD